MAMVMENQQPVAPQLVPEVEPPPLPPPPPPPPSTSLPQAYKHHCKVCNKGFTCGPALGGHMRAHGVTDDVLDDHPCGGGTADYASDQAASPWATTTNKRMYALRANPGRLKSCRVCENCGKEFTSWKSLLDHGRCSYDDDDAADDDDGDDVESDVALAAGWSKGKRTRRGKLIMVEAANGSVTEAAPTSPYSSEEEDLANCLVMLSSSSRSAEPSPVVVDADDHQDSSALAIIRKDDAETTNRGILGPQPISMMAPTTMAPELKLLAPPQVVVPQRLVSTVPRGMFECKACKKVFTSHQALGGHRASHKNVKGCFAAKLESHRREPPQPAPVADIGADANTTEGNPVNYGSSVVVVAATAAPETLVTQVNEAPVPSAGSPIKKKKGKVHECSICHRVFMSGQALGGHKRCHWLTTGSGDYPTAGAAANLHHPVDVAQDHVMHAMCQQLTLGRPMFHTAHPIRLDLNAPMNNRPAEPTAAKAKQAAELNDSVLCLNAPASLYMQSWTVHSNASNVNMTATSSRNDAAGAAATEDEADSRYAKKGKIISDLKDMNVAGETSPWLQVGIGHPSKSKEKSIEE